MKNKKHKISLGRLLSSIAPVDAAMRTINAGVDADYANVQAVISFTRGEMR